ncbi:Cytochrome c551 peroxidase precursor [Nitrincola nitratireducens]|uniref:Cytochrome c551 peroxidase n=2 Tax=Oceanospirillaceae TaxID=135620 RepID=W9V2C4_9GAMM|nr:Cytochrome c551 peroxidase precursor [Nitrincola nitratireducens]
MIREIRFVILLLCCIVAQVLHATILPVPNPPEQNPLLVKLGEQLFHDERLSGDKTVSCATCHALETGGMDLAKVSTGVGGKKGVIRAPSVFNSHLNHTQFWDGRVKTLEAQVDGPLHDELEMASNWPLVIGRLNADPQLRSEFKKVFDEELNPEQVRIALAAFQRTLMLTNSPFDRWLAGDMEAITAQQKNGFRLFQEYGCISCHQGANVGGNMFARMGSLESFTLFKSAEMEQVSLGRYNVTGNRKHLYVFKVPGLRTAALNHYFFHDSSASSLEEAIDMMARVQLGRQLTRDQAQDIAEFIRSLLGEHPLLKQVLSD